MAFPALEDFPVLYRAYHWEGRFHQSNDFTPDNWDHGFPWILHLEEEFADQEHITLDQVLQVLMWGGNQRNFNRVRKLNTPGEVVEITGLAFAEGTVGNWDSAIVHLLDINQIGLTYASKLLRFRFPQHVGALDLLLRGSLGALLPRIKDGTANWQRNSMANGFVAFRNLIEKLMDALDAAGIVFPGYPDLGDEQPWTLAGVEMALFSWTQRGERTLSDCLMRRPPRRRPARRDVLC